MTAIVASLLATATDAARSRGILDMFGQHPARRVLAILVIAVAAHVAVVIVRRVVRTLARSKRAEYSKIQTLSHFAGSVMIFVLYFTSAGLIFRELGVSLTAYFASATVIGFAVSFGSQGLIQDVITSLTVIFSNLLDVGDMVDIGGQVGIVERIGIRYTVLVNLSGARVFVPNRNVANVVNYEAGYVRVYLDARIPPAEEKAGEALARLKVVGTSAFEQFRGAMLLPPEMLSPMETSAGHSFARFKFRMWPGQGAIVETAIKQLVVAEMRAIDPSYVDAFVVVHYRAESSGGDPELPTPTAVSRRAAARRGGRASTV